MSMKYKLLNNCLTKILHKRILISFFICGALLSVVIISIFYYINNSIFLNHLISDNLGDKFLKEFTYTRHILRQNELYEMINIVISEDESIRKFGKQPPKITYSVNGEENHSYFYIYNPNILKKLKMESPDCYKIGFELVFQEKKLKQAIEYRNSFLQKYYDSNALRSLFVENSSMDSIIESLGNPKEIQYQKEQIMISYVYKKSSNWLLTSDPCLVYINVYFKNGILFDMVYDMYDLIVEEEKGRLFIKQIHQKCHCLGEKAQNGVFFETPKQIYTPLEQYQIHSMDQLRKKASNLIIISEQPLVISFKP